MLFASDSVFDSDGSFLGRVAPTLLAFLFVTFLVVREAPAGRVLDSLEELVELVSRSGVGEWLGCCSGGDGRPMRVDDCGWLPWGAADLRLVRACASGRVSCGGADDVLVHGGGRASEARREAISVDLIRVPVSQECTEQRRALGFGTANRICIVTSSERLRVNST